MMTILITAALAAAAGFFAAVLLTGSGRDDAYRAGRRDAFNERYRWELHEVERDAAKEPSP